MGAEAVGKMIVWILDWVIITCMAVWLVRKVWKRIHAWKTETTENQKFWWWIVGCVIVVAVAHSLGLHWLEGTAGGFGVLLLVAGTVTEIDDRIRGIEQRVEKLERQAEEKEHLHQGGKHSYELP